mmetsp:Transcript_107703/g.335860  ORF Transcript_107703/g.335860 Transcript_107703/m.335860 type:complete len:393 (-) Transcript_107703:39-1217(-)
MALRIRNARRKGIVTASRRPPDRPSARAIPVPALVLIVELLPGERPRLLGLGADPVADALPVLDGRLQELMQRVEGGVVRLAVVAVPIIHGRARLYRVVGDNPAAREHDVQLLQLVKVIMERRAALVHEDHVQRGLSILLAYAGNKVLDHPDPHLSDVREPGDVRDVPRYGGVHGIALHGGDPCRPLQPRVLEEHGPVFVPLGIQDLHLPPQPTGSVAHKGTKLDHGLVLGGRLADDCVPEDLRLVVSCDLQPLPHALGELVNLLQDPLRRDQYGRALLRGLHFLDAGLQVLHQHAQLLVGGRESPVQASHLAADGKLLLRSLPLDPHGQGADRGAARAGCRAAGSPSGAAGLARPVALEVVVPSLVRRVHGHGEAARLTEPGRRGLHMLPI